MRVQAAIDDVDGMHVDSNAAQARARFEASAGEGYNFPAALLAHLAAPPPLASSARPARSRRWKRRAAPPILPL